MMEYSIIKMQNEKELTGRDFVGVSKSDSTGTQIVVPYGVQLPDYVLFSDKEHVKFLKMYVKAIQKALNSRSVKNSVEHIVEGNIGNPVAAVNIVADYVALGQLIEYEHTEKKAATGKINFSRTIQKIQPLLVKDGFVFDEFITDRKTVKKDSFVALVQGNVINHFMDHGGEALFGTRLRVDVKPMKLSHQTIIMLKKEQAQTFNSRKQMLIRWMIAYLDGANIDREEKGDWQYAMIASSLWETMVNAVFGNQRKLDKSLYGKQYAFYSLKSSTYGKPGSPTQHDTIYEDSDSIFIIDAKMYGSQNNLLSEEVLGKQFGYYVEASRKKPDKVIVNILLLPTIPERGDEEGFSDDIILDPHTTPESDPDRIIFVYHYSANQLIKDYYYSRKHVNLIKEEFTAFVEKPYVWEFLESRSRFESRIYKYASLFSKKMVKKEGE